MCELRHSLQRAREGEGELDLAKEIGSNRFELLLVRIGIEKPQGRGEAAKQRVPILRSKTGPDDLSISPDG